MKIVASIGLKLQIRVLWAFIFMLFILTLLNYFIHFMSSILQKCIQNDLHVHYVMVNNLSSFAF